jgi:DNA-binding transcriptional LysR family regulator
MFTPMASHPVWHMQKNKITRAIRVDGQFASDDIDTLIAAALADAGVVVAADWLVASELKDGRLIEVLGD